jgi:hypothetical protein
VQILQLNIINDGTQAFGALLQLATLMLIQILLENILDAQLTNHTWQTEEDLFIYALLALEALGGLDAGTMQYRMIENEAE